MFTGSPIATRPVRVRACVWFCVNRKTLSIRPRAAPVTEVTLGQITLVLRPDAPCV